MQSAHTIANKGLKRGVGPHFVPSVLANSAAARVALLHSCGGPQLCSATACAAGSHAIIDAIQAIERGNIDVMLAGATEAALDVWSLNGFCRLRALSTQFNDSPELASRPFANERDGFVMGEGAVVLVLEDLEHAMQRGATILAAVCGFGATGDAHHVTAPHPEGDGARRAMEVALSKHEDADIGYINAHATSTPMGDEIEARAIDVVLGQRQPTQTVVSSTKGATGHLLGAAGALEVAVAVQTLATGLVPATRNLEETDLHGEGNHTPQYFQHVIGNQAVEKSNLEFALNNSFGFGGTNASILFRRTP